MKQTLLIAGFSLFGLISCDRCGDLRCPPPFDTFEFNYVSVSNEDLLGGTTQKYMIDDIKFYSITRSRIVYADISIVPATAPDLSLVEVNLRTNWERAFIEIKGVVTDTVDFKFIDNPTKCCGTGTTIDEMQVNGINYVVDHPVIVVEKN